MADDFDTDVHGLNKILINQLELEDTLLNCETNENKKEVIIQYIENIINDESLKISEFGLDLEWINTEKSLSLKQDLKGKIIVLDFFTYCCINCMHILPDLKALEEEIPVTSGLIVVGVHSAKFDNERELENVIEAIRRYEIHHPVVNDPHGILWNKLEIHCWPTLIIIGPNNTMLFALIGEGHKEQLILYCKAALEYFTKRNQISNHQIQLNHLKLSAASKFSLLFPGKICLLDEKIIISDSGHHRLLVLNKDGTVNDVIGGTESGFKDGNFAESRFHSPQGVTCKNSKLLYVADTENHAIRKIDLEKKNVKTIAGTGKQGYDKIGGKIGIKQEISSPWDVCLVSSNEKTEDLLFIAMAGTHQIWVLALEDAIICKESLQKGTCINFAGSGNEENRNNKYRRKAGFAQPSGIVRAEIDKKQYIYIADSESSSIRCISLSDGSVTGCIGGHIDPSNLFAYGDIDGIGINAKLQHPMGIAYSISEKMLYIADTYNNKIKIINPLTKNCTTLSIKLEEMENKNNCKTFYEPGGLCLACEDKILLVADTNNHAIKVIDLKKRNISKLNIIWNYEEYDTVDYLDAKKCTEIIKCQISLDGCLKLFLEFDLDRKYSLNKNIDQTWQIQISEESLRIDSEDKGSIENVFDPLVFVMKPTQTFTSAVVSVLIKLYLCHNEQGICLSKVFKHKVFVHVCNETLSEKETIVKLLNKL